MASFVHIWSNNKMQQNIFLNFTQFNIICNLLLAVILELKGDGTLSTQYFSKQGE